MWLRRTYTVCSHGSPTCFAAGVATCPERTRLAVRHVRHCSVSPLGSCSFGWMSYFFRLLWVASHWCCHFAGLYRRGWEVETKLLRECRRLFTDGGDGGCVARLSVVRCARSGSERCAVFLVGRCRTARRGLE